MTRRRCKGQRSSVRGQHGGKDAGICIGIGIDVGIDIGAGVMRYDARHCFNQSRGTRQ